ncbi:hypothetical protein K7432_006482 [Basidiobolus ranarum]|uniref:ditrans,polycis-polyprenyl diphosphate synthase [(2E,6E)-farnesyldiphosphate specific] n=1 Tax=Basidiobolus ranarum TaxID=34480 RepID=A0ABR2W1R7_9FUNG
MRWLYACILFILHWSFKIYLSFLDSLHYLKTVFANTSRPNLKTVDCQVKSLKKLPRNLGMILPLDAPKDQLALSIANLASWCIAAGIPYLTIFSSREFSKNELANLAQDIVKATEEYFVECGWKELPVIGISAISSLVKYELGTFAARTSKQQQQRHTPDLRITLLSENSGKHSIAEVSKRMVRRVLNEDFEAREIDISTLDNALSDIPEPQLLLHFGKYLLLEGFPPWQLRLTEIYNCIHTGKIMYSDFINAVYRYARCDQRFGK